jgi:hypothetical protein
LIKVVPATGVATVLLNLPSAASQIVASQDGVYLYLLSEPWSAEALTPPIQVMRVRLSDLSIDQTVPLTSQTLYAAQIAVSPTDSNTWSAAFAPQIDMFEVELFDGSTARPAIWSVTSNLVYGNEALWKSDGTAMYILDANLDSVTVGPNGLGNGVLLQSGASGQTGLEFGGNLQLADGLIYNGGGGVLNPANDTILGRYVFPSGVVQAEVTPDTANNRLFAAYTTTVNNANQGTIQSFNLSTFAPIWIARLSIGTPPLRWGSNGLAWIGPGATAGVQALYLINGAFVAP